MKTNTYNLPVEFERQAVRPVRIQISKLKSPLKSAFTLIELLVVIAIIGILAAFLLTSVGAIKRQQYIKTAQAEMGRLETALENYKAKYGVYPPSNQNPNSSYPAQDRSQFSQLYYELSGTTNNGKVYLSPDGNQIVLGDVPTAYGVGGFINCDKGSGEDAITAKNFLPGLSAKQLNDQVTNTGVRTTMIVTSVGGPDQNYQPLSLPGQNVPGLNPFRYVYPGIHNPSSYDLWVQLSIGASFSGVNTYVPNSATNKYLICNWTKTVQKNSPQP